MKAIKLSTLFVFLLLTVVQSSCNKEKLTTATQVGANTFSCKVNGKVYVASSDLFSPAFSGGFYRSSDITGEFRLSSAIRTKDNAYDLRIEIPIIDRLGVYRLNELNFCLINPLPITIGGKLYSSKLSNDGEINITYIDYQSHILSGTFSFTAINTNDPSDQLLITDGRFDIQTK